MKKPACPILSSRNGSKVLARTTKQAQDYLIVGCGNIDIQTPHSFIFISSTFIVTLKLYLEDFKLKILSRV